MSKKLVNRVECIRLYSVIGSEDDELRYVRLHETGQSLFSANSIDTHWFEPTWRGCTGAIAVGKLALGCIARIPCSLNTCCGATNSTILGKYDCRQQHRKKESKGSHVFASESPQDGGRKGRSTLAVDRRLVVAIGG